MRPNPRGRSLRVLLLVAAAAALHVLAMAGANAPVSPPDAPSLINSVSFTPHPRESNPERGDIIPEDRLRKAMAAAKAVARGVRTYTVSEGLDAVPAMADEMGLNVTLGIWIDHDAERGRREIERAVELARHRSVNAIIVGNESVLTGNMTPAQLVALMREVRARTGKPVSTAEPWHIWLDNPQLAEGADFIAVHVLPYWMGKTAEDALAFAKQAYADTVLAFPGRRVQISEFGWPSGRTSRYESRASRVAQARAIREFAGWAEGAGIDWNLIELTDQVWKVGEGRVGAYWGILDADLDPKFPMVGPLEDDTAWRGRAAVGALVGAALALLSLLLVPTRGLAPTAMTALVGQAVGWATADAAFWPVHTYVAPAELVTWVVGVPMLLLVALQAFERAKEAAAVAFGSKGCQAEGSAAAGAAPLPRVSIHVPACNERPEVVGRTLEALARLDYPDFEVLLVVNNTRHDLVGPLQEICGRMGSRFRFLNFPKLPGFKAGAMNRALEAADPAADIIGVVDADYVVLPGWLRETVPHFTDPRVGIVQAPQDHREVGARPSARAMDAEYSGFFDVGMVERSRDDAIVAHGTMLLVRKAAIADAGGWDEAHICEDTKLGLSLMERGWRSAYTSRRLGHGLLPDDLVAFRSQRWRWAYGGMRIMLAHWRSMLPGSRRLTPAQRWHFLTGWMHWIGDALGVAASLACVPWAWFMAISGTGETPPPAVAAGLLAAAALGAAHALLTYGIRVSGGWRKGPLAILAALSLQIVVARAVVSGLLNPGQPFKVTAKGGRRPTGLARLWRSIWHDAAVAGLLASGIGALLLSERWIGAPEQLMLAVMLLGCLPFLSSLALLGADAVHDRLEGRKRRGGIPADAASALSPPANAALPGVARTV